MLSSEPVE